MGQSATRGNKKYQDIERAILREVLPVLALVVDEAHQHVGADHIFHASTHAAEAFNAPTLPVTGTPNATNPTDAAPLLGMARVVHRRIVVIKGPGVTSRTLFANAVKQLSKVDRAAVVADCVHVVNTAERDAHVPTVTYTTLAIEADERPNHAARVLLHGVLRSLTTAFITAMRTKKTGNATRAITAMHDALGHLQLAEMGAVRCSDVHAAYAANAKLLTSVPAIADALVHDDADGADDADDADDADVEGWVPPQGPTGVGKLPCVPFAHVNTRFLAEVTDHVMSHVRAADDEDPAGVLVVSPAEHPLYLVLHAIIAYCRDEEYAPVTVAMLLGTNATSFVVRIDVDECVTTTRVAHGRDSVVAAIRAATVNVVLTTETSNPGVCLTPAVAHPSPRCVLRVIYAVGVNTDASLTQAVARTARLGHPVLRDDAGAIVPITCHVACPVFPPGATSACATLQRVLHDKRTGVAPPSGILSPDDAKVVSRSVHALLVTHVANMAAAPAPSPFNDLYDPDDLPAMRDV